LYQVEELGADVEEGGVGGRESWQGEEAEGGENPRGYHAEFSVLDDFLAVLTHGLGEDHVH